MTKKIYLQSDSLSMQATVLNCEPSGGGQYHVCLDATLFHPQGGGQPADTGSIGESNVLTVFTENERVVHVTDAPILPGIHPTSIDGEKRQLNSRMHSAGHLIAVVVEPQGWQALKASHRPGEGRVVFEASHPDAELPTAELIAAEISKLVQRELPRYQALVNGIRKVTWGDLPEYACGGTHVCSTALIGEISITGVKFKKGALSVSYELPV